MRIVLDSSVLVAAFRSGEPFEREAFAILEAVEQGRCSVVVPMTVPIEVVAAIRRRTGSGHLAGTVGERLLAMPAVTVSDLYGFRLPPLLALARQSGLRGMDVVVVGTAVEFDLPLVTLDTELARRARRYVDVMPVATIVRQLVTPQD